MSYLFTSESVSEGHPDKIADQISDAILDEFLRRDPNSKVACETLVTTGLTVLSGEIRSNASFDYQEIVRNVIKNIGYTKSEYMFDADSCKIISTLHKQSDDIYQGVDRGNEENQGAGDQGIMFGYAINETRNYMPLTLELSHLLLKELAIIRKEENLMNYLRPDSKAQVTIEYDDNNKPCKVNTIVISTQHDEFADEKTMLDTIKRDIQKILIPRVLKQLPEDIRNLFNHNYILHVNPTGKFVIGGPHGDTGLTGRKIIVDTYGGKGAHGGGAFSGKDSSKVDRSAAYAARHIAKNMVAAGVADEILVQVAYAIGIAEPIGLYVNTYGTAKVRDKKGNILSDSQISKRIKEIFDLRPFKIINQFGLKNPIFLPTATYGHMGKESYEQEVKIYKNGEIIKKKVTFFPWEKLDKVNELKELFNVKAEIFE